MAAELRQSPQIKEAVLNPDPSVASTMLLSGMINVLDRLAPTRRVQIRTNGVPYLSVETRELQISPDHAHDIAHETGSADDWRLYRSIRNQVNESIKKDQNIHLQNKIDSKNPNIIWQTVRKMSGLLPKGPPTSLTVAGKVITSPRAIATAMN